jgi:hypothetical protein
MDKKTEILEELDKINPNEWHNIPDPLINGIVSLKSCIKLQHGFIEYLYNHFNDSEIRNNSKFLTTQKTISETAEKVLEIEAVTQKNIKNSEIKFKETLDDTKDKISSDIQQVSFNLEKKQADIIKNLRTSQKQIEVLPKLPEIQIAIQSQLDILSNKLKQDFKENILNPEINTINLQLVSNKM